ncbi:MAG: hypothetical protein QM719_12920 [Thermomonas sp.]
MDFDRLDNNELLAFALQAVTTDRDAEAMAMLKTLIERDPGNVFATYLLAAQHAQLGMMDRAETGFRTVVQQVPDFPVARFQLGQLLLVKGANAEAHEILAPLTTDARALGAYARVLSAISRDDVPTALAELEQGLAQPQEIPALEGDMRRLHDQLQADEVLPAGELPAPGMPSALFLSNYGRGK